MSDDVFPDRDDSEPQEVTYGLVMPFVACEDQGGPFAADAFVAGFVCGIIDHALPILKPLGCVLQRYVDPRLVPQLDLMAMRYGFKMTSEPWDEHPDDYTLVTFDPAVEGPHDA